MGNAVILGIVANVTVITAEVREVPALQSTIGLGIKIGLNKATGSRGHLWQQQLSLDGARPTCGIELYKNDHGGPFNEAADKMLDQR